MADIANKPLPVENEDRLNEETPWERFKDWVRTELVWYAGSFSFHLLGLSLLLLVPNFGGGRDQGDAPWFEAKANEEEVEQKESEKLPPVDITDLNPIQPEELIVNPNPPPPAPAVGNPQPNGDDTAVRTGCLGRPDGIKDLMSSGMPSDFGPGPKLDGASGIGPGRGTPDGNGLGGFGPRTRKGFVPDRTPPSERAVNAALVWLANHQDYDGHWSLQHYTHECKDKTCSGEGELSADAGATAMGLLPFLAAGQTHKAKCPYKEHVHKAVQWLIAHQQSDGNLAQGAVQMMYSHGLATIALCEAYGLTGDKQVGMAAQGAVNFILSAQNTADGGWRYNPKDPGDTSVVGWQLMALKSAHMAGLSVGGSVFSGTSKWLDSVAVHDGAEYAYQPNQGPSPTMTSVGLLCRQYLARSTTTPCSPAAWPT